MPGLTIDGNSFADVAEAAHTAIERARAGGGPTLIECLTYRHRGHSKSDRNRYRTKEEIESWVERDPIVLFEQDLLKHGMIEQHEVDELVKSVEKEIEDSDGVRQGQPGARHFSLTDFVYASPVTEAAHG
jgi:TPP-dependent pyruvate/acetoin dehydrogenase alpha subunit